MNRLVGTLAAVSLVSIAGVFAACEDKNKPAPAGGGSTAAPTPPADKHDHAAGDKHDHDHDHDHAHGAGSDLGSVTIGGFALKVSQEGAIKEGEDAGFEIEIAGTKPTALRAWIGTEDAKGSVKVKAEAETDGFHLHVEAPKPLPAGAKLWMELESAQGQKTVGSIALKR